MAHLSPAHLQCLTVNCPAEAVTDAVLGFARVDMKLFRIDIIAQDVGASYTSGTIALEYDDGASGADTAIDTLTLTSPALSVSSEIATFDLTSGIIPQGSRILATVATLAAISENFLTIHLWYVPGVAR